MSDDNKTTIGCGGCLGLVLFVFVVWAMLFGVTWGGIHYQTSCSCDDGVQIIETQR